MVNMVLGDSTLKCLTSSVDAPQEDVSKMSKHYHKFDDIKFFSKSCIFHDKYMLPNFSLGGTTMNHLPNITRKLDPI